MVFLLIDRTLLLDTALYHDFVNRHDFFVALFDFGRFFAMTHIELSKPGNTRHQLGRMLAVDPGLVLSISLFFYGLFLGIDDLKFLVFCN